MPIRWWGILKGIGIFYIGTITGSVIALMPPVGGIIKELNAASKEADKVSQKLEKHLDASIASCRQQIQELEAKGDSESWDKAQDLKIELNKKEASKATMQELRSKSKNKSFEWSKTASFEFPPPKPKDNAETKVIDAILVDLYQNKIDELEANGDSLSMDRAEEIKARLRSLKASHHFEQARISFSQRD